MWVVVGLGCGVDLFPHVVVQRPPFAGATTTPPHLNVTGRAETYPITIAEDKTSINVTMPAGGFPYFLDFTFQGLIAVPTATASQQPNPAMICDMPNALLAEHRQAIPPPGGIAPITPLRLSTPAPAGNSANSANALPFTDLRFLFDGGAFISNITRFECTVLTPGYRFASPNNSDTDIAAFFNGATIQRGEFVDEKQKSIRFQSDPMSSLFRPTANNQRFEALSFGIVIDGVEVEQQWSTTGGDEVLSSTVVVECSIYNQEHTTTPITQQLSLPAPTGTSFDTIGLHADAEFEESTHLVKLNALHIDYLRTPKTTATTLRCTLGSPLTFFSSSEFPQQHTLAVFSGDVEVSQFNRTLRSTWFDLLPISTYHRHNVVLKFLPPLHIAISLNRVPDHGLCQY